MYYNSDLFLKREVWALSGPSYTIKNPWKKTLFTDTPAKFYNFGYCIPFHPTGSKVQNVHTTSNRR